MTALAFLCGEERGTLKSFFDRRYHGEWRNDERHGEGTMQYASGNLYTV